MTIQVKIIFQRKHRNRLEEVKKEMESVKQPTLNTFVKDKSKYSTNDPNQLAITYALILFIAGDLQPLSFVESKYFRNFVEKSNQRYQLPSRKHLTQKLMSEKSSEVQAQLKDKLLNSENVCLSIDIWSSRHMRVFLGNYCSFHSWLDTTFPNVVLQKI